MGCSWMENNPGPITPHNIPTGKEGAKDYSEKHGPEKSDKGKDASDAVVGRGALGLLRPSAESDAADEQAFSISPERHVFLALFKDPKLENPPDEATIQAHFKHLHELTLNGQLDSAGSLATTRRGLQVLIAGSREEAEALIESDPIREAFGDYELEEVLLP